MSKRFNRLAQALYLRQTGFREHLVAVLAEVKNGSWEDEDWLRDMVSVLKTPLNWVGGLALRYTEKEAQRWFRILVGPDEWYGYVELDALNVLSVRRFKYRMDDPDIREDVVNTFIKRLGLGRPMRA